MRFSMRHGKLRPNQIAVTLFAFIGMVTVGIFLFSAASTAVMNVLSIEIDEFVRYLVSFLGGMCVGILLIGVALPKDGDSA